VLRLWFVSALVLGAQCSHAQATCVDPSELIRSTASITRIFDDQERRPDAGLLGIRGTAWFLSPTFMVTAEHVAARMRLDGNWSRVEIASGEGQRSFAVRVVRVAGAHTERISVLELRTPFLEAESLQIRIEPLAPEERVVSLAYPSNRLRFARGRFVEYGDSDKLGGTALFEMYDGDDRLVLDHGASGAPVLDCQGRVVAVVSNLFTQTMRLPSNAIRISTAWGQANVASIPIQVLKDVALPK
jgi:Trypsin-like peptidase domain